MRAMSRLLLASAATLAPLVAQAQARPPDVVLTPLGSHREFVPLGRNPEPRNICRVGTSQIAAYDPFSRRLFVTDALADPDHNSLDILDIREPLHPVLIERVKVSDLTGSTNFDDYEPPGVASAFGLVALAIEANHPVKANGRILLLDHDGRLLRTFDALGSGPERVVFSPNGRYIVAAVQGEQDPADATDPKGGITVIDLSHGIRRAQARFADFAHFSSRSLAARGIRIGPDPNDPSKLNPAAYDLEPHSITVSPDSRTAFATLEHNNALALVDLGSARVTAVLPFGLKDHARPRNGLDASKKDGLNIAHWPVRGAYMPDGIGAFAVHGRPFLVTANEGDTRDLLVPGDAEPASVSDAIQVDDPSVALDPAVFPATGPNGLPLKDDSNLGGLEVSSLPQDARPNALGQYRRLVSFGGRSLAVWTTDGQRVYDSGDQLERITSDASRSSAAAAALFNTPDDDNSFDNRSPRRGPQPSGVVVGRVAGRTYGFVGLRKEGGIVVADLTNPDADVPMAWFSTRDYAQSPKLDPNDPSGTTELDTHVQINCARQGRPTAARSDLGPEGLLFIPARLSPNLKPLLVVNYDTSGSTRLYEIDRR